MKTLKQEDNWDKKKIIIFSIAVIGILLFFSYRLIDFSSTHVPPPAPESVKGISADDLSKGFQETIQNLQQEAQNLDVEDVATSSPQVQKIINDLKALKDVPKSQLKSTCQNICSGL